MVLGYGFTASSDAVLALFIAWRWWSDIIVYSETTLTLKTLNWNTHRFVIIKLKKCQ